jgi:hypothetical protein
MSGHTPGPWMTDVDCSGWSVGTEDKFIAFTNGEHSDEDISPDEEAANARLMAAAPDLLKELKKQATEMERLAGRLRLYGIQTLPGICDLMAEGARATIARAEGA